MKALDRIIKVVGSQAEIARALDLHPMAVSHWKSRGTVPAKHCMALQRLTNGKITAADIRPDIFSSKAA